MYLRGCRVAITEDNQSNLTESFFKESDSCVFKESNAQRQCNDADLKKLASMVTSLNKENFSPDLKSKFYFARQKCKFVFPMIIHHATQIFNYMKTKEKKRKRDDP